MTIALKLCLVLAVITAQSEGVHVPIGSAGVVGLAHTLKNKLDKLALNKFEPIVTDIGSAKEAAALELDKLIGDFTDFFCPYMGCLYGSHCALKSFSEIGVSSIARLEAEMEEAIKQHNAEHKFHEEEGDLTELLEDITADNFLHDVVTLSALDVLLSQFESLIDYDTADNLGAVIRDVASDFVKCECRFHMTGLRCDECTHGFSL